MLLSLRQNAEEEIEVCDLDRNDKVVAVFKTRDQAIRFMRRKENLKFTRA